MHGILVTLHVLAAAVWLGGTVALVFVAVPVVRTLEGAARAHALRTLGRRWRPLGWGAAGVLVCSGVALAHHEGALHPGVLLHTSFGQVLLVKSVLTAGLLGTAALHDFVLGPRLAREIRERRPPTSRRRLVLVGWTSFTLSVVVPVLGVALAELPPR